jgi:hypothetical protein
MFFAYRCFYAVILIGMCVLEMVFANCMVTKNSWWWWGLGGKREDLFSWYTFHLVLFFCHEFDSRCAFVCRRDWFPHPITKLNWWNDDSHTDISKSLLYLYLLVCLRLSLSKGPEGVCLPNLVWGRKQAQFAVSSSFYSTERWTTSKNSVIMSVMHNLQKTLVSKWRECLFINERTLLN